MRSFATSTPVLRQEVCVLVNCISGLLLRRGVLSPFSLVNPPTSIAITRLSPFCVCSKTTSLRPQAFLLVAPPQVGWYNFSSSGWWKRSYRSLLHGPAMIMQPVLRHRDPTLLKLSLWVWRSHSWFLSHLLLQLSPYLSSSATRKPGTDCQPCVAPTKQVSLELEAQSREILLHWAAAEASAESSFLSSVAARIPTAGQQSIPSFHQQTTCGAT